MKAIDSSLKSLGFLDGEIRTYVAVLENGPQTVLEIAKKTQLSRQTIYDAIEVLQERDLMTVKQLEKKILYVAEPPSKLLTYAKKREAEFKEQIEDLNRTIPSLELCMAGESRPVVKMYEGKEGILAMIGDLQRIPEGDSFEICDGPAMLSVMTDEDLAPFRKVIKSKNFVHKGILSGVVRPAPRSIPGHRKFLPREEGNFKSYINVVDDIVTMSTYSGKLFSLVIKNKQIADAMRIVFKYAHQAVPGPEV